jgi:hypothetical protein
MQRRDVTDDMVQQVVASAEQRFRVREGRVVWQSRVSMGTPPTMYLVRVVVEIDRRLAEVVTVFRTTRVNKYWRDQP